MLTHVYWGLITVTLQCCNAQHGSRSLLLLQSWKMAFCPNSLSYKTKIHVKKNCKYRVRVSLYTNTMNQFDCRKIYSLYQSQFDRKQIHQAKIRTILQSHKYDDNMGGPDYIWLNRRHFGWGNLEQGIFLNSGKGQLESGENI